MMELAWELDTKVFFIFSTEFLSALGEEGKTIQRTKNLNELLNRFFF